VCCTIANANAARLRPPPLAERPIAPIVFLMDNAWNDDEFFVIEVAGNHRHVPWGAPHEVGSAAYWVACTKELDEPAHFRLADSLIEEVAACILGGYGMTAEVGLAAFTALRDAGLLQRDVSAGDLLAALSAPLSLPGSTRIARYRYPRQRSDRLAAALRYVADAEIPTDGVALRDWLLGCPGVGPKTASWVARNWSTAAVAIVDVHVQRAGVSAGVFDPAWRLPRDYAKFETSFLAFATAGSVPPALLDTCIWQQLHELGRSANLVVGYVPDVLVT
jgi:N-glycosylase/DNA lyase